VSRTRYESAAARWRADADANDERAAWYELTGQPRLAQQQRPARDVAQQLATPDWAGTVDELLATAHAVVDG
jgi:hypothetical protein